VNRSLIETIFYYENNFIYSGYFLNGQHACAIEQFWSIDAYESYQKQFDSSLQNLKNIKFNRTLEHKTGIDLTVSSTLKKPSNNYTCFILRRFGLFLIHLQSKIIELRCLSPNY